MRQDKRLREAVIVLFIMALAMLWARQAWSADFSKFLGVELKESEVNKISQAIYKAEGSERAKKPFGILSVPCSSYAECEKICKNTIRNNWERWQHSGKQIPFLDFLGGKYAPVKSNPLNANWVHNVNYFLDKA